MRIKITGGRIIDPFNELDKTQDLFIEEGKILARGQMPEDFVADTEINAKGQIVCPGLVDLRARLREPGFSHKGTIASETLAAAHGGITTLCCPPDTNPVIDTPAVVELIHQLAEKSGMAKVVPLGALTQGLKGKQLSEMNELQIAGCVGVSNGTTPVGADVMRRAMEYATSLGLTVYLHSQDPDLSKGGYVHEGTVSVRLGLPGIPETAETIAVSRDLQLVELTDVDAHFCQLSTAGAVKMIARSQYDGLPVTSDVTAHHLFLTEMDIGYFNTQCHVQPPLRTERDRDALREALVNGTISAICSDHQPHDLNAKLAPFTSSEPGISGLETLLPLTLRLVEENVLNLSEALARITVLPANILGIDAGTLNIGTTADICIFDPESYWELTLDTITSFGKNTPFLDWDLKGRVTHTISNGRIVFQPEPDVNANKAIPTYEEATP